MNQPWVIALIVSVGPTLLAAASLYTSLRTGRKTDEVSGQTLQLQIQVDGAMEKMREDVRKLATITEKARGDAEHAARADA